MTLRTDRPDAVETIQIATHPVGHDTPSGTVLAEQNLQAIFADGTTGGTRKRWVLTRTEGDEPFVVTVHRHVEQYDKDGKEVLSEDVSEVLATYPTTYPTAFAAEVVAHMNCHLEQFLAELDNGMTEGDDDHARAFRQIACAVLKEAHNAVHRIEDARFPAPTPELDEIAAEFGKVLAEAGLGGATMVAFDTATGRVKTYDPRGEEKGDPEA